ncbi:MAG: NAD(P)H-binding protein [Pirellulales bacterium]
MQGADVVVDVANSPSWEDQAVLDFFTNSTRNLLAAEAKAGVRHHVALSVVGTDRIPDSGYMRAKVAQEREICAGNVPYTILRATQFLEFLDAIADFGSDGTTVRLPPVAFQPVAAEDVAAALAQLVLERPKNGTLDLGGPERMNMDEMIRRHLALRNDARRTVADSAATYYGSKLLYDALVPTGQALTAQVRTPSGSSNTSRRPSSRSTTMRARRRSPPSY